MNKFLILLSILSCTNILDMWASAPSGQKSVPFKGKKSTLAPLKISSTTQPITSSPTKAAKLAPIASTAALATVQRNDNKENKVPKGTAKNALPAPTQSTALPLFKAQTEAHLKSLINKKIEAINAQFEQEPIQLAKIKAEIKELVQLFNEFKKLNAPAITISQIAQKIKSIQEKEKIKRVAEQERQRIIAEEKAKIERIHHIENTIDKLLKEIDGHLLGYHPLESTTALKEALTKLENAIESLRLLDFNKAAYFQNKVATIRENIERKAYINSHVVDIEIKIQELVEKVTLLNDDSSTFKERVSASWQIEELEAQMKHIHDIFGHIKKLAPTAVQNLEEKMSKAFKLAHAKIDELSEKIKKNAENNKFNAVFAVIQKAQALAKQIDKHLSAEYPNYNAIGLLKSQLYNLGKSVLEDHDFQVAHIYEQSNQKEILSKLMLCKKISIDVISKIKKEWEKPVIDYKNIKKLQKKLMVDLTNLHVHLKDYVHNANHHDPKIDIIPQIKAVFEMAWPYLLPDLKQDIENMLEKIKKDDSPDNQNALKQLFHELIAFIKIAKYAPTHIRAVLNQLFKQVHYHVLIKKQEHEIQTAFEVTLKELSSDSTNMFDNRITDLIKLIKNFTRWKATATQYIVDEMQIYTDLFKKIKLNIELRTKQLDKKAPFNQLIEDLQRLSKLIHPFEILIAEIEQYTQQEMEEEKKLLYSYQCDFFKIYVEIIEEQIISMAVLAKELKADTIASNESALISLKQNIETLCNKYGAAYYIALINLESNVRIKKAIEENATQLLNILNNCFQTISKQIQSNHAEDKQAKVTRLTHVCSLASTINDLTQLFITFKIIPAEQTMHDVAQLITLKNAAIKEREQEKATTPEQAAATAATTATAIASAPLEHPVATAPAGSTTDNANDSKK